MRRQELPAAPISGIACELVNWAIRLSFGGRTDEIEEVRGKVHLLGIRERESLRRKIGSDVLAGSYPISAFRILFGDRDCLRLEAAAFLTKKHSFDLQEFSLFHLLPVWQQAYAHLPLMKDIRGHERVLRSFILEEGSVGQVRIVEKVLNEDRESETQEEITRHFLRREPKEVRLADLAELKDREKTLWAMIHDAKNVLDEITELRAAIPTHQKEGNCSIAILDGQLVDVNTHIEALQRLLPSESYRGKLTRDQLVARRRYEALDRKRQAFISDREKWVKWTRSLERHLRSLQIQLVCAHGPAVSGLVITRRLQRRRKTC